MRLTLLRRGEASRAVKTTRVEAPETRCTRCGSENFHESTTYDARRGKVAVYKCDDPRCGHRFTWRPGFKKKWFGDAIIVDALVDAAAGHPPARIEERLAENGISVNERTIRRWIDEYAILMERFALTLPYAVGGRWSLDEKYLKTHPGRSRKKYWLVAGLDETTDMILGYDVTDTKSGYDATDLLERIIDRIGRVPDVTVADRLPGFYCKVG